MYFATKDNITKEIQKQDRELYSNLGWSITTDGNNEYDEYDYELANKKGNCLQPIIINGEQFQGYSSFFCINSKVYVEEPERTYDGSIPNINDYETFIVPRVKISFKYMTISDFRRFLKAITPNEFNVTYYDYETNQNVTYKMYCETREMSKIFNRGYEILAIQEQEISLIATLNNIDYLTITYNDNVTYYDEKKGTNLYYNYRKQNMIFGNTYSIDTGNVTHHKEESDTKTYRFKSWNTRVDGKGIKYLANEVITATNDLILYAQWDVIDNE